MLIINTFHVSVTRHHTWVYLGQGRRNKYHSLEKTMGFGSDMGFQKARVNRWWFFCFLSRYGRGKTPGEMLGNTKALRGYSKDYLGSCRAQGSQQLDEDKSPEKCTCFSVLQVHENPRRDHEWPDRPPRAPWIPGTGWTNIPRRWVLKETGAPPLWVQGRNICPMVGTVWEGKQEHRSSTWGRRLAWRPCRTWSILTKQTNRQKWCWQESKGEKAWTYALLHCSYRVSLEFFLSFWFVSVLGFFCHFFSLINMQFDFPYLT